MNNNESRLEFLSNSIVVIRRSLGMFDKQSKEYIMRKDLLNSLISERDTLLRNINID